ncbi:MAG: hypothetical protein U0795_11160 [Pirellulales bacterium]
MIPLSGTRIGCTMGLQLLVAVAIGSGVLMVASGVVRRQPETVSAVQCGSARGWRIESSVCRVAGARPGTGGSGGLRAATLRESESSRTSVMSGGALVRQACWTPGWATWWPEWRVEGEVGRSADGSFGAGVARMAAAVGARPLGWAGPGWASRWNV